MAVSRAQEAKDRLDSYVHHHENPYIVPRTVPNGGPRFPLPHAQMHRDDHYYGDDRASIGTSMLRDRSSFTDDNSLPGFSRNSSPAPSDSISNGIGERQMNLRMRILVPAQGGALEVTSLPPLRRPQQDPVLECPFRFLHCPKEFPIDKPRQWIQHSLTHFRTNGPRPKTCKPPQSNRCCFCDQAFYAADGQKSWQDRMEHIRFHHGKGHQLAHSRLDQALVEYLWQRGIIDKSIYRELKPRESRGLQNIAISLDSPTAAPVAYLNENRSSDRR